MAIPEPDLPIYTIHQYREDFFKVVMFKVNRSAMRFFPETEEHEHYDSKLSSAFSRARSNVLQYGLCNDWQYFFTGTIDKNKFDRFDLDTYYKSLSQWIRDERKRTGSQISFLLVPEHHKDGAWHIHGLISNLPDTELEQFTAPAPEKLILGHFLNWPRYQHKFGFCSLAPIRDPIATAFYISKYVSKDFSRRADDLGKHLYFHSRPLKKAQKASEVYAYSRQLDEICTHDYEFCKTGMCQAPWYFPYAHEGADFPTIDLIPADPLPSFDPSFIDPFYEQIQMDW